jgi:hypothetical protein
MSGVGLPTVDEHVRLLDVRSWNCTAVSTAAGVATAAPESVMTSVKPPPLGTFVLLNVIASEAKLGVAVATRPPATSVNTTPARSATRVPSPLDFRCTCDLLRQ